MPITNFPWHEQHGKHLVVALGTHSFAESVSKGIGRWLISLVKGGHIRRAGLEHIAPHDLRSASRISAILRGVKQLGFRAGNWLSAEHGASGFHPKLAAAPVEKGSQQSSEVLFGMGTVTAEDSTAGSRRFSCGCTSVLRLKRSFTGWPRFCLHPR